MNAYLGITCHLLDKILLAWDRVTECPAQDPDPPCPWDPEKEQHCDD